MNYFGSVYGLQYDFRQNENELSDSLKGEEFLDQLTNY